LFIIDYIISVLTWYTLCFSCRMCKNNGEPAK